MWVGWRYGIMLDGWRFGAIVQVYPPTPYHPHSPYLSSRMVEWLTEDPCYTFIKAAFVHIYMVSTHSPIHPFTHSLKLSIIHSFSHSPIQRWIGTTSAGRFVLCSNAQSDLTFSWPTSREASEIASSAPEQSQECLSSMSSIKRRLRRCLKMKLSS